MVHLVAYDLTTPNDTEENYTLIIDAIKAQFNSWCHIEQSVWLIDTQSDAASVRDLLWKYMHKGDVLFVGRLSGNWGSQNFGEARNNWLNSRAF
jgi:hypothetical protein